MRNSNRHILRAGMAITTLAATLLPGLVSAQGAAGTYPIKPITIVIANAAGGSNDLETRLYTRSLTEGLGQPILLDYKPGAGNLIGNAYAAKAAPDGYTLLNVSTSFAVAPAFFTPGNVPYDPVKDFTAVSLVSSRGAMLVANPKLGVKTLPEYIAYARANPGKINFGTTGPGTIFHIVGAWLHSATNTKVTFIHYKGVGPMVTDLVGGRLEVGPTLFFTGLPFVREGRLLALANTGMERSRDLPDLKSISEQGVVPGFQYSSWSCFVAPARTPVPIVNRLSTEFAKAAKAPDLVKKMESEGIEMVASTPEYFQQLIARESVHWSKIVQDNNIRLEE